MKLRFALVLFFIAASMHAKFMEAEILFNDGHTEKGLVKSFLENRFLDYEYFSKIESAVNLNDKSLKFKTDENGTVRTIGIDDVNELTLFYKNGQTETFKVLYLKAGDKELKKDPKYKMWFPLVKEGRINVYGFEYVETKTGAWYEETSKNCVFYFQDAKKDYALRAGEDFMTLGNFKKKPDPVLQNFMADLFSACPEFVSKGVEAETVSPEVWKEMRKEMKLRRKTLAEQKISRVRAAFEIDFYKLSDLFMDYETQCIN
jgi:hypothetical protein